eukprot:m.208064 g.208064  ORF g.208064 m.208064 type:complete len:176 (+) comp33000_c0_seq1:133-660(+)
METAVFFLNKQVKKHNRTIEQQTSKYSDTTKGYDNHSRFGQQTSKYSDPTNLKVGYETTTAKKPKKKATNKQKHTPTIGEEPAKSPQNNNNPSKKKPHKPIEQTRFARGTRERHTKLRVKKVTSQKRNAPMLNMNLRRKSCPAHATLCFAFSKTKHGRARSKWRCKNSSSGLMFG